MIQTLIEIIITIFGASARRTREAQQKAHQEKYRYSVNHENALAEHWFLYRENEFELSVPVEFDWLNRTTIFTDGLKAWSKPRGLELSDLERAKVLNRLQKFGEIMGGVTLDTTPLLTAEEIKADLEKRCIEYQELDDGVISYTSTADEIRKDPKFFKNR